MGTTRDYYDVLGVPRTASRAEIRRAYRKLARQLHPDVNPSHDATQQMQELNRAYQVLRDPHKRATYDRGMARPPDATPSPAPPRSYRQPSPRRAYTPPPKSHNSPPQRRTGPPPYQAGISATIQFLLALLAELFLFAGVICNDSILGEMGWLYVGAIFAPALVITFGFYACSPFQPLPREPARSLGPFAVAWGVVCVFALQIAFSHPSSIVNGLAIGVGLAGVGYFVAHAIRALRTRLLRRTGMVRRS